MNTPDLLSDLAAAGFTEYEARIYLALLSQNPATGYQISKQTGVPRSMVYEALGRLSGRGAVLKTIEPRATLFRPVPPDVLLDRFDQEHQALIQNLRHSLRPIYNAQTEERLWAISGRSSILTYAQQMLQSAQSEVAVMLDDPDLQALRQSILACRQRGAGIHALLTGKETLGSDPLAGTPQPSDQLAPIWHIAYHPPLESQLQELNHTLLIVVDGKECLIASAESEIDSMNATITNNRNLVLIARQFVWMELFTQRIYAQIGPDLLPRLDPQSRQVFENLPI